MKNTKFIKNYYSLYKNWPNVQYIAIEINESEKNPKTFDCLIFTKVKILSKPEKRDIEKIEKLYDNLLKMDPGFNYLTLIVRRRESNIRNYFENILYINLSEEILESFIQNFETKIQGVLNEVINFKSIYDLNNRMKKLGFVTVIK